MRLCFSREFVPANSNHISSNPFKLKVNLLVIFNFYIFIKVGPYTSYYSWRITMKKLYPEIEILIKGTSASRISVIHKISGL